MIAVSLVAIGTFPEPGECEGVSYHHRDVRAEDGSHAIWRHVRHVDHGTGGSDQAAGNETRMTTTIDGDYRESPSLEQRGSRIASSPLYEFIREGTSVNAKPPENARFERRSTTGLPKNRAQVLA